MVIMISSLSDQKPHSKYLQETVQYSEYCKNSPNCIKMQSAFSPKWRYLQCLIYHVVGLNLAGPFEWGSEIFKYVWKILKTNWKIFLY